MKIFWSLKHMTFIVLILFGKSNSARKTYTDEEIDEISSKLGIMSPDEIDEF